jgi:hypothetical protein
MGFGGERPVRASGSCGHGAGEDHAFSLSRRRRSPQGAWKPSLNLSSTLSSIQLLMSHPNPDDGLMLDIVRGTWGGRAGSARCELRRHLVARLAQSN